MTITVESQPEFAPPRNRVTMTTPAGGVMQSVSLDRKVGGVLTPTLTQPAAGLDSRLVDDYGCPYGVPVTYVWTTSYVDPSAFVDLLTTSWPNLTGWTTVFGSWNVSAGKLRNTSTTADPEPTARLDRGFTLGKYRVTLASMSGVPLTLFGGESMAFNLSEAAVGDTSIVDANAAVLGLIHDSLGGFSVYAQSGADSYFTSTSGIDFTQPITIDFNTDSITVTGTGGTVYIPFSFPVRRASFHASAKFANDAKFGALAVKSYPAAVTLTQESAEVTLDAAEGWLVHPSSPAKSVPMSYDDLEQTTLANIGPALHRSTSINHRILGEPKAIAVSTGPRAAPSTTLLVGTETADQRRAVQALLADSVPVLVRFPASWELDFDEGYYSVGDVNYDRAVQLYGLPARYITLPLDAVEAPIVSVEGVGWTWAAIAAEFDTWEALSAAFATWADVLSNSRRPGY